MVFLCNLETLRRRFHALVYPATTLGVVNVIDLDADGARINRSRFAGVLTFGFQLRSFAGTEKPKRIQVTLEVSPLAVSVENTLALGVWSSCGFDHSGTGAAVGSLGFRGHRSTD